MLIFVVASAGQRTEGGTSSVQPHKPLRRLRNASDGDVCRALTDGPLNGGQFERC